MTFGDMTAENVGFVYGFGVATPEQGRHHCEGFHIFNEIDVAQSAAGSGQNLLHGVGARSQPHNRVAAQFRATDNSSLGFESAPLAAGAASDQREAGAIGNARRMDNGMAMVHAVGAKRAF